MTNTPGESPELEIEVTPQTQSVGPGEERAFAVRVRNRSSVALSLQLSVSGLPSTWLSIDFDSARRWFPDQEARGLVLVTIPAGTNPTVYEFAVTASSESDQVSEVWCTLEVEGDEPILAPGLDLTPPGILIEQSDRLRRERIIVTVRNPNPIDRVYSISLQGLDRHWFEPPPAVTVTRASAARLDLWMTIPPNTAVGSYEFHVTAADTDGLAVDQPGRINVVESPETPVPRPPPVAMQTPARPGATPFAEPVSANPLLPAPRLQLGPSTRFLFDQNNISEQAILTIENVSDIQDQFVIELNGLPNGWFSLGGNEVSIPGRESAQLALRLSPTPNRNNPPGEYHFSIRVTPRGFPDATSQLNAVAQVQGRHSFTAHLEPSSTEGRRQGRFELIVQNDGTEPLEIKTDGEEPEDRVRFKLPAFAAIAAGDERRGDVRIGPRRSALIGSREIFDFRVSVEGGLAGTKELSARFIHRPVLSWRLPPVALYAVALTTIVLLLILWLPDRVESGAGNLGCWIHSGPECDDVKEPPATVTATPPSEESATPSPTPTVSNAALACLDGDGQSALSYVQIGHVVYADDRLKIREDGSGGSASDQLLQIQLKDQAIPVDDWEQALGIRIVDGPFCSSGVVFWKVTSEYPDYQQQIDGAASRTSDENSGFAFVAEGLSDGSDTFLWASFEEAVIDACGRGDERPDLAGVPAACSES